MGQQLRRDHLHPPRKKQLDLQEELAKPGEQLQKVHVSQGSNVNLFHGCSFWVLEHMPSHRPSLYPEVPTSSKGWPCAILAQRTAEAQRSEEVLQDHPLHFPQGRKDLVYMNGHASVCRVCVRGVCACAHVCMWKGTKMFPCHVETVQ